MAEKFKKNKMPAYFAWHEDLLLIVSPHMVNAKKGLSQFYFLWAHILALNTITLSQQMIWVKGKYSQHNNTIYNTFRIILSYFYHCCLLGKGKALLR